VITDFSSSGEQVLFLKTAGPSTLSFNNIVLNGHSKDYHADGFSSPVGKLKGITVPLEDLSLSDLSAIGIEKGKKAVIEFESGIQVSGMVSEILIRNNKVLIISFTGCTVLDQNKKILFDPSWGIYDMAIGEKVVSVFCGAADKEAFEEIPPISNTGTYHTQYDADTLALHQLYLQVRNRRYQCSSSNLLRKVWQQLKKDHAGDWLCALEILEILDHEAIGPELASEIRAFLESKAANEPELNKLINDGFYLIKHPVEQRLVV